MIQSEQFYRVHKDPKEFAGEVGYKICKISKFLCEKKFIRGKERDRIYEFVDQNCIENKLKDLKFKVKDRL